MGALVLRDLISKTGARVGLAWVSLLLVLAVFAPLIASSHPLLMKTSAGVTSSPWLTHLTSTDWTLFITLATALILLLLFRSTPFGKRLALFAGIVVVSIIATNFFVPTRYAVLQSYREAQAEGEIAWAIRTPIPYSPDDRQGDATDNPRNKPPTAQHWLGTTGTGADLASNMIHATRIALTIGFISTGIAVVVGVVIGGLMGYFAGWVDLLGMRLVEIFSAVPTLLLLLCFVAVFKPNLYMMMVIIGLTSWDGYAVFTRAEYLSLRNRDFVQSAIAAGLPLRSVLFRHMLPNSLTPVIISASFGVASAILSESTLSFLGIGLGVDEASWGKLLSDARSAGGTFYWWLALSPGLAIFLTVFAYNLIGEAMRDALDPKLKKRD